jgi:hypothetical protein
LLRDTYGAQVPPMRAMEAEGKQLERRVAAQVNEAYGLTREEIDLLWRTAPPRMPVESPQ